MGKYFLCMIDGPDGVRFQETEGVKVTFKGFEEFHFFIHVPPGMILTGDQELWVISEATTGLSISGWATSPKAAKEMAAAALYKAGIESYKEKLEAHIQKHRLSPWTNK